MSNQFEKYANTFAKMIQCPTVSASGAEYFDKFQQVLKEQFPLVFSNLEVYYPGVDKDEQSRALLLKWRGKSSARPMVLMAHQDVVPADPATWTYPPYAGTIDDGKVWGRGTMDCKNTLFITINAVEELLQEGFVPENDVYLSYSDCEENSGMGAPYAVEWFKEHDVHPVVAVDEGGAIIENAFPGMKMPFAMVGILEKGYADVKFTAHSKGGHSSSPPNNTPIARLSAFVNYCETHVIFKRRMSDAALQMLKGISTGLGGALGFITKHAKGFAPLIVKALPAITPFGKALLGTTMTFTMAEGSKAPNVIPQSASVVANLRFGPGDKSADCIAKLTKLASKYDIEVEVLTAREHSATVDITTPEYKHFVDTMREQFPNIGISPYLMFGGTDCRHMQTMCLAQSDAPLATSILNNLHQCMQAMKTLTFNL
ncbi:MAG: M20/M25/M40 family metallo-hydrolase [Clostridia bacterium]|nr:M20/M25/M40 family metallo-hydrolase [Clostridia bacterium]